ncbi:branched-chain amino acid aminotransferase [Magnetospirillum sp. SS-4]|uniref:branched-chain amino acid aminotransferase n=1 Tax=Magnetospirillum sp. SS-4 TaxID=2681465 RepID=UPI001574A21B|nr:branched-chain amino acid aminotransferase [Magnetospirillum sp. SS-4]
MAAPSFDDRDGFIWFDGKLVDWRAAGIHVLTHGLHYGSCVFEGERVYNGKVFKLREHSQRLLDSARILGFEVPFSVEQIDQATLDTIKANNIVDGYVRPVAWRGSEMMGVAAQSSRIRVAIATWSWPSYWSPEARMRGIRLNMSEWKRPHPETAPTNAKAAGLYMICTMSKHKAEGDGYEDSLMLDWRGQVAEATGANIFFVYGNELHTPLPDCFLNGITRQTVIDLARARGIKVVERAIMPEEMINAAECFLTGTAAEVTPVREIGTYTFTPGEITRQLIADYDALVRS